MFEGQEFHDLFRMAEEVVSFSFYAFSSVLPVRIPADHGTRRYPHRLRRLFLDIDY